MPISQQIKQAFSAGTTILTSTVRAARWLKREYALEQRAAGLRVWTTPPIVDWDTWLKEQWHAMILGHADAPLLLTSLQERRVWTQMLKADAEQLLSPAGMAALAESAYGLLGSYQAQEERRRTWGRSDADSFRRWAADFDAECARRDWLSQAQLETHLVGFLAELDLPKEILLVGFERITPAQESVLQAIRDKGVSIAFAAVDEAAETTYVRAAGRKQEIEACATWVREQLKQSPESRIGVLTPDLGVTRSEIERAFRHVLMPQSEGIFFVHAMPFEFSLGVPLADVPVVRAALLLLRWLYEPITEEEVTWLMLSGFLLQDLADFLSLAKLDAARRDGGALSLEISLGEFLRGIKDGRGQAIERLEAVLKAAEANHLEDEERLSGRWADIVQLLLREAGWPGGTERDTIHFQAMRRWERALDEVALLDFDGQRMQYGDFLNALAAHAQEVIFAPESEGAPVQIMGTLEAAGQLFDAVWFLSADDQSWPPRGRPHPLLPNELQRRYRMPYADPAVDLELAKAVTEGIAASAASIVFSFAERNKDGEMRPSPVIRRDAVWQTVDEPQTPGESLTLEKLEENSEVVLWPQDKSAGGSDVLKKQAACPFQAFAGKRLFAEPLNRNEWGLSAAERGQLLHDVLRRIWMPETGTLHTLEQLQAAKLDGRLDEILRSAIAESFAEYDKAEGWERAYIESEKHRLLVRLKSWFDTEAERAPFTVIACEEKLDHVNVGELKLRLRVDRVDELTDGGRILIDYKSGDVKVKDWETPRPDEPQLPLYAVFGGVEDVRGVLFAKIRAGVEKPVLGSVASDAVEVLADKKENKKLAKMPFNAELRAAWSAELQRLADDFLRGDALVDPKDGKNTCKYCGLQGLCRVTELQGALADSESESEGDDA